MTAAIPAAGSRGTFAREFMAIARLELSEVLRSRWLLFCLVVYAVLGVVFVLVGMRESSVVGFTGTSRALLSFSHALVLLLPLLGLTATGQVINRARDDGALELLFSHPVGRGSYFAAVTAVRLATLAVPLVVLLPGMALWARIAFGEAVPWGFLARALLTSTSLLAASVAIGLAISARVRNQAKALMLLLLVWAAFIAFLDFALAGLMLQWRLQPQVVFTLAVLNPVQCARMALLSAVEPELATLGPVGFYLAHRVGAGALLALGICWPALLALSLWSLTLRSFVKRDLV